MRAFMISTAAIALVLIAPSVLAVTAGEVDQSVGNMLSRDGQDYLDERATMLARGTAALEYLDDIAANATDHKKRFTAKVCALRMRNATLAAQVDAIIPGWRKSEPPEGQSVMKPHSIRNVPEAMGKKLADLDLKHKPIPHFGVKESVFPFNMYHEVDPLLGPEMRSTGEVLGMADSFGLAFYKSQEAAKQTLPCEGDVLITVSDDDKPAALEVARQFAKLRFGIRTTEGTQKYFADNGIKSDIILKMYEGRPGIVDEMKSGKIQLVINTPVGKKGKYDDSYIRKTAIKYQIPYITTLAAAKATVKGIAAKRAGKSPVKSLQRYHADIK